jgi:hypothetical protein
LLLGTIFVVQDCVRIYIWNIVVGPHSIADAFLRHFRSSALEIFLYGVNRGSFMVPIADTVGEGRECTCSNAYWERCSLSEVTETSY